MEHTFDGIGWRHQYQNIYDYTVIEVLSTVIWISYPINNSKTTYVCNTMYLISAQNVRYEALVIFISNHDVIWWRHIYAISISLVLSFNLMYGFSWYVDSHVRNKGNSKKKYIKKSKRYNFVILTFRYLLGDQLNCH